MPATTKLRERLDRLAEERPDVTVKALADRAGYSRGHTHEVLSGKSAHPRAVRAISLALDSIEQEAPTPNE